MVFYPFFYSIHMKFEEINQLLDMRSEDKRT